MRVASVAPQVLSPAAWPQLRRIGDFVAQDSCQVLHYSIRTGHAVENACEEGAATSHMKGGVETV